MKRNWDDPRPIDPLVASRHPFETYLLALSAVSGIPLLFGEPTSGTIDDALPPAMVLLWGSMLVFGSIIALVGLYWRGLSTTGLVLERAGLVGVGGASLIYSTAILLTVGLEGLFSGCIISAFGLACFTQARRISFRLHDLMLQVNQAREDLA